MKEFSKYVGLDTHKETIAVAVADALGGKPQYYGEIANTPAAVRKLVKNLCPDGEMLSFCYEAGPCGYEVYRQISQLGHHCSVVAPSLIPLKPGERVKTDRRDSEKLSRLDRAGELTPVWVPDQEQEAMRDLTRAREDMKGLERTTKQRLNAFLLRYGRIYESGKSRWTQTHFRWLEGLKFDITIQQIVFQEYVDAVKQGEARVVGLEKEMEKALKHWVLAPVVEALMALRGIKLITAMTIMAELGDITRFDSPRQLMSFLGLVPSEFSSGQTRRRGGITKTGNGHVRRVLIESGWCYRFPARKTAHLQRRAEKCSSEVQAIAWKAQKHLCGRYAHLLERGKLKVQVCTAVARELVGFIWAIACEVMNQRVVSAR
ncbi:MAG: IS110 family transposase [Gammaproteobacteria bacterium]|nr:IS110 family transposase [Gammaproteobacteria bacterium]